MIKRVAVLGLLLVAAFASWPTPRPDVRVASKKFTESVILGEMMRVLIEDKALSAEHLRELGGSRLVFEALVNGEIDAYPEYTGTLIRELLANRGIESDEQLDNVLAEMGVRVSRPLGFNNTYGLGMRRERADELGIQRISDLARYPNLRFGFSNEFTEREDGWPGLRAAYDFVTHQATGLDHDIAYRQLELEQIDAIDVYTTDARIRTLGLTVLEDDRDYFPRYDAVILYRAQLAKRFPEAVASLLRLEGQLSEDRMVELNGQVESRGKTESEAAADCLESELQVVADVREPTRVMRIVSRTLEHLDLVRQSLLPAILFGVPLGVIASKSRWLGQLVLAGTGIVQTIPALALLVLLMPLASVIGVDSVGTGSRTAILALFLYSLLPIVRNTYMGLTAIEPALLESAEVLNLPSWYRMLHIELPLASRSILAGVKTAAVINVGFATLGALVGAGGYGQPILSGIRLADTSLILEGAVPAAVLALTVQALFDLVEPLLVPAGLRLKREAAMST
jgi:osmoprotectant transport system permease protein